MTANLTPRQYEIILKALVHAYDLDGMELLLRKHTQKLQDLVTAKTRELAFAQLMDAFNERSLLPSFLTWVANDRDTVLELVPLASEMRIMSRVSALVHERDALIELLDETKLDDVELLDAYRAHAAEGRREELEAVPWMHPAAVVVYALADTSARRDRIPVIELAIDVARRVGDPLRDRIEQWVKRAFDACGVNAAMRNTITTRVETGEEPFDLYMRVVLERQKTPQPQVFEYVVTVYRQRVPRSDTPPEPAESLETAVVAPQDVDGFVVRHIVSLGPERRRAQSFTVEIFADHRDFARPFDQIPEPHPTPMAIGAEFDVLLRSWDRHFSCFSDVCLDWDALWRAHLDSPCVRVCDRAYMHHQTYRGSVKMECVSNVLLDFVPATSEYAVPGPVWTMLMGGTPVAVWARPALPEALLPEYLAFVQHLRSCPAEWPKKVREKRLEAETTTGQHLGRHLCLLYDKLEDSELHEGFDL